MINLKILKMLAKYMKFVRFYETKAVLRFCRFQIYCQSECLIKFMTNQNQNLIAGSQPGYCSIFWETL